jgi:hypothetical protein
VEGLELLELCWCREGEYKESSVASLIAEGSWGREYWT